MPHSRLHVNQVYYHQPIIIQPHPISRRPPSPAPPTKKGRTSRPFNREDITHTPQERLLRRSRGGLGRCRLSRSRHSGRRGWLRSRSWSSCRSFSGRRRHGRWLRLRGKASRRQFLFGGLRFFCRLNGRFFWLRSFGLRNLDLDGRCHCFDRFGRVGPGAPAHSCMRTHVPSLETPHPTPVGALWSTQPERARPCMHARMHARRCVQQRPAGREEAHGLRQASHRMQAVRPLQQERQLAHGARSVNGKGRRWGGCRTPRDKGIIAELVPGPERG